jgi:hypothetical protein
MSISIKGMWPFVSASMVDCFFPYFTPYKASSCPHNPLEDSILFWTFLPHSLSLIGPSSSAFLPQPYISPPFPRFITSALKVETVCIFKMLACIYVTTWHHNPKQHQYHTNRHENLKSHKFVHCVVPHSEGRT